MSNKLTQISRDLHPCVIYVANRSFALTSSRMLLLQHFIDRGWKVVAAVNDYDEYATQLSECGVIVEHVVFNRGGLAVKADLQASYRLYQIYDKYKPNLIHHYQAKPIFFGNLAAWRLPNICKVVNSITGLGHAFIVGGYTYRLASLGYRLFLRRSDMTIFENPDDHEMFISRNWVKSEKTEVIVSVGVDSSKYVPRLQSFKNEVPVVLMAARLIWQKGVREYVEAAEQVKKLHPEVRFCLAGEFDLSHPDAVGKAWIQQAVDNGIIEFLGYLKNMSEQLQQTDIFVLPSYREGMPRVLLEAASSGVPVVTVDTPGCREGVVDGVTGRLVAPKNSIAIAEAIVELIENSTKRCQMGKAGRERVLAGFDICQVKKQYLNVYRKLGIRDC